MHDSPEPTSAAIIVSQSQPCTRPPNMKPTHTVTKTMTMILGLASVT